MQIVDEKRMFTPYVSKIMDEMHGVIMHLTDMERIKVMQMGTIPRSKTNNSGALPYDKTHLLLGRKDPGVVRISLSPTVGQTESIPDDFSEDGKDATLPSWVTQNKDSQYPRGLMAARPGVLLPRTA